MFAHGMCQECFREYLENSGGTQGRGANPPAFQRAEKQALLLTAVCAQPGRHLPASELQCQWQGPICCLSPSRITCHKVLCHPVQCHPAFAVILQHGAWYARMQPPLWQPSHLLCSVGALLEGSGSRADL